jgi:hypothetical protein
MVLGRIWMTPRVLWMLRAGIAQAIDPGRSSGISPQSMTCFKNLRLVLDPALPLTLHIQSLSKALGSTSKVEVGLEPRGKLMDTMWHPHIPAQPGEGRNPQ